MPDTNDSRSSVIPGMQYRRAPEAIEWLCRVFGFEKRAVFPGPDNSIMHAELTLGGGMIMLGSANGKAPNRRMKLPSEVGGAQTRSVNLTVKNADEVYARAQAGGAEIVEPIEDKPQGGRGFACLDPEGHLWHVGTYDPWAPK